MLPCCYEMENQHVGIILGKRFHLSTVRFNSLFYLYDDILEGDFNMGVSLARITSDLFEIYAFSYEETFIALVEKAYSYLETETFYNYDEVDEWPSSAFLYFVFLKLTNKDIPKGLDFGEYQCLVDKWDQDLTQDELAKIMDYRLKSVTKLYRYETSSEFDEGGYDLIPWEFIAIRKCWEKRGLKVADYKHEFLDFPLEIPTSITPIEIDEVRMYREKIESLLKS